MHRLFAAAGLAHQERFQLDAQLLGPARIQGVFGVDEGGDAALALGLGHDVQGERRLAAGFRSEDLHDAAAGNALAAQGQIQRETTGRNAGDHADVIGAEGHDGPFAELFFDLGDGRFQGRMSGQHRFAIRLAIGLSGRLRDLGGESFLCHGTLCSGLLTGGDHEISFLL